MSSITIQTTGAAQPFTIMRVDFHQAAIVSDHAVEEGANVSDHIQVQQPQMVIEAIVSNTGTLLLPQPGGVPQAVQWLEAAMGQLLTVVVDNEGVFEDYAFVDAVHPRTVIEGRVFTLRLRHLRIGRALSVEIPPTITTNIGAASPTQSGQQSTTETERGSILFKASESLAGFLDGLGIPHSFGK